MSLSISLSLPLSLPLFLPLWLRLPLLPPLPLIYHNHNLYLYLYNSPITTSTSTSTTTSASTTTSTFTSTVGVRRQESDLAESDSYSWDCQGRLRRIPNDCRPAAHWRLGRSAGPCDLQRLLHAGAVGQRSRATHWKDTHLHGTSLVGC